MTTALKIMTIILIFTTASSAYEVDQFTKRSEVPKDSLKIIDAEINKRIEAAIKVFNSSYFNERCNSPDPKKRLQSKFEVYKELATQLANRRDDRGYLEGFAEDLPQDYRRKISFDESIYNTKQASTLLRTFGLGSVINVNGHQVGTDKLGHFFNEGLYIYKNNQIREDETDRKKVGTIDSAYFERNYYGLRSTGVKSYADMVANFDGQSFWEKICVRTAKEAKTLCEPNSYLQCNDKGKWELNPKQNFSLKNYVTSGWDESINCNSFNPDFNEGITQKMAARVDAAKKLQPCPVEPAKCLEIIDHYRGYNTKIVNPICLRVGVAVRKGRKIDPEKPFNYSYLDEKLKTKKDEKSEPSPTKSTPKNTVDTKK
ncbi:MAG: hypothetical protein H7061_05980 [Bdellovibrionaceae bacterium]|nr:hypothetical protein [Bdellovibrio sp.]